MKYIIPIFLASILALQLASCNTISNDEVKKYIWRYSDGFHVKDVLEFDNNNLRGDTIYSKNKPMAIIINRNEETPFTAVSISIKDLYSGEVGTYHAIGYR